MATREENLKKINAQLELMSDDELDQIAGGTAEEMADDSRFLNSLNGSTDRHGAFKIWLRGRVDSSTYRNEIKAGWATVGITAELDEDRANRYYLDGKQITQEDARQHAMKVTKHFMTEKDWNW